MKTRRDFIRTTALGATVATVLPKVVGGAMSTPAATNPGASQPNDVTRQHRNLFNGDTCTYFYNPEIWQPEGGPYSAKAIHRYVETLAKNGIDTFVINANASKAWYPSKKVPTILDGYKRGDREFFRGHAICAGFTKPDDVEKFLDTSVKFYGLYVDLIEAGVDWLAETSKACRQQTVAPWVSIRMNDLHGHHNFEGSFFNHPLLQKSENRLHHSAYPGMSGMHDYREGLNYELPVVRESMMDQIREVVEDYDFEGLELDWWRNPVCCEPNASEKTVAMMSDWFREIRALTQRRAAQTGRPYYLGMRIPGKLETLRSIGIDVVTLCQEGTLDFLGPSAFWRTAWDMPHDLIRRQVGPRPAVYGVIEDGANAVPALNPITGFSREIRLISSSREMLAANAAGKLVLGADGIEWFNFFCTDQTRIPGLVSNYTFLRNIQYLDKLRGEPKHYTVPDLGFRDLLQPPFDASPVVPVTIEHFARHNFRLPMCAEPTDRGLKLVIQIVVRKDAVLATMPVSINNCWPNLTNSANERFLYPCGSLTHHTKDHVGYDYEFPVSLLRDGWNEITVENGAEQPLTIVCVELAVTPTSRPESAVPA